MITTSASKADVSPDSGTPQPRRRTFFYDVFLQAGTFAGVIVGTGVGFWAAYKHSVRIREGVVLTSDVGAAIGLLAVSLAAMTIVLAFLQGIYKSVIRKMGDVKEFFRPFKLVAVLSGAAAITGIISSLESNVRPLDVSDAVFGLSVGLLTWAIVQSVQLVFVLAQHGVSWFNLDKARSDGLVKAEEEKAKELLVVQVATEATPPNAAEGDEPPGGQPPQSG